jgi:predicted  nucleic acid-binding Zn-ribbon protein
LQRILETLIELQKIDNKLMKLKRLRGNLPQQVEELQTATSILEADLSQKQDQYDAGIKERVNTEGQIVSDNEKLKKFREQIYSVKSNKEYDALSLEIETKENEISNAETRVLELLEQEETLKKEVEEIRRRLDALKLDLDEKNTELKARLEQTEEQEKELKNQRKAVVKELNKPIYSAYERIRKGKGGKAVATIDNGVCTGCSSNLPPQMGLEIRKMNQIINCQTCGRFLIWQDNQHPEHEELASNPEQVE